MGGASLAQYIKVMANHEVQVEECPVLVPTENDPGHVVEDFNLVPSSWQIVITLFLKHTSEHLPIIMILPSLCSQSRHYRVETDKEESGSRLFQVCSRRSNSRAMLWTD